jgi:hypothetical protein
VPGLRGPSYLLQLRWPSVPSLFGGDHTIQEIEAALPTDPRKVFNAEFLDAYGKGDLPPLTESKC